MINRRTFFQELLVGACAGPARDGLRKLAFFQGTSLPPALCHRIVTEYELPPAVQTHELVKVPNQPLVLVSQMSNSNLVKVWLDPQTEQITGIQAFPLGPPDAMLHGLAVSTQYPGKIWATHEAANSLLLVDPGVTGLGVPPQIIRTIPIPGDGKGPHAIGEYKNLLWVTLKTSNQILAIDHTDPKQYWFYPALAHPIFVACHPASGDFYASQDEANKLLRISFSKQATSQIAIPPAMGKTPVGLVAGPVDLWVVLLGTAVQGTGTFGRITAQGDITWFRLSSPEGHNAGLLHMAFDATGGAWLLGSSILSPNALDLFVHVTFDATYTHIQSEETAALPTQLCKAHRLLPLQQTVLATELTSATVAQVQTPPGCSWNRPTTPIAGEIN
jgi:virginiamycin B lyase